MKKGFIGIFILLGIAFLAVSLLKQGSDSDLENRAEGDDSAVTSTGLSKTEVIDFWKAYDAATELRTAGEYDRALSAYRDALAIDPDHQNSLYYRGNLLLRKGRYREAEQNWKKLAEVNPSSARAYSQLGTLYSCRDSTNPLYDLDRAAEHFDEAAHLNREETGPLLQLAKIDLINRRYKASLQKLNDVISSNFRSAEALFLRGFLEWRTGNTVEADTLLARSISIVTGTTDRKNVGEGATKKGASPFKSELSRCALYSGQIARLVESADPGASTLTTTVYSSFDPDGD